MRQQAILLIMASVILGLATPIYALRHPRRKGEPLGNQRKIFLGISLLALLGLLAGAVIFFRAPV